METEPKDKEPNTPEVTNISRKIIDKQGDSRVFLSIVKYNNAIQASLYDREPKLGSMTLAFPVLDSVERQTIFAGKHDQLSAALAMLLVRSSETMVYASVNLSEHAQVQNELLREMISEYTDTLNTA